LAKKLDSESIGVSSAYNSIQLGKEMSVVEEEDLELYKDLILDSTNLNFNIFDFAKKIKRSRVLPTLAKQTIESMQLM
jgi:hypothetical protein